MGREGMKGRPVWVVLGEGTPVSHRSRERASPPTLTSLCCSSVPPSVHLCVRSCDHAGVYATARGARYVGSFPGVCGVDAGFMERLCPCPVSVRVSVCVCVQWLSVSLAPC